MSANDLPLLKTNPMRFAKVGAENAHLKQDNPKAYVKLVRKVNKAIKDVKKDWRKQVREAIGEGATNRQVSKFSFNRLIVNDDSAAAPEQVEVVTI